MSNIDPMAPSSAGSAADERTVRDATSSFFIKKGYLPNPVQRTYDESEVAEYWTEDRIRNSRLFQYHVYEFAARLIEKNGYGSFLDVGSGPPTKVKMLIEPVCDNITLVDQPTTRPFARDMMPSSRFLAANLEECEVELGSRYDLIVCADVLEHLLDPNCCSDFIREHLSGGGLAVISTPERDVQRGVGCMASGHPSHVREWSRGEFCEYLSSRGFDIVTSRLLPAKRIGGAEFQVSRLLSKFYKSTKWSGCHAVVCRRG